jgi:amidohydrolase
MIFSGTPDPLLDPTSSPVIQLGFKQKAWRVINERRASLEQLALHILDHPELPYAEAQASEWLSEALLGQGFDVTKPLCGLPTAFRACRSAGEGPTVAFLAEYDALPEMGHGCGHNLIGPAAVGAACGVAAVLAELGGSVWVLGTPAEEFLGQEEGKTKLLRAAAFSGVDVALMMHPHHANCVQDGDLGFIAFDLTFRGRPAHAAASPWNGVNALDGLLLTFNNINALRQQVRPEIRIHGIVTDGGQAPNIIPERASARIMVRAADPQNLSHVFSRVQDCANAGALASGTNLELHRVTTVYNTRTNATLNGLIRDNCRELDIPIEEQPFCNGGSTDFGNVSQALPAATFWAHTHPDLPFHTPEIAQVSGDQLALSGMISSACVLVGVAIDILADGSVLERVRDDFQRMGSPMLNLEA